MLALRSSPPLFGTNEAERIARDVYGMALSVRSLSGERDCNFHARDADGHDYVLKVLGDSDEEADCTVQALRHVAEQDAALPIPRLHLTLQGLQLGSVTQNEIRYATCLTSYLPGRALFDEKCDSALTQSAGAAIARLDRALRGFFHPALSRSIAWDVRRLPQLLEFAHCIDLPDLRRHVENIAATMRALTPSLRGLHSQAIHGDCHGGNILIDTASGAVAGILDFGDMIHAPLILEPAVAMAELLGGVMDCDALGDILSGYAAVQALEAEDIAALYDLICARHATTLVLHAWRGRHDPAGARVLDRAAATAARSLEMLMRVGREALTQDWQRAAGTSAALEPVCIDMGRRRRLMGAGAELFYEQPLHLVRGEGVWLYDAQGRAHLDVYNNVPHVGHCHPTVVRAIQRQTAVLSTHTRYLHGRILDYAERLVARCPPHLDACIFVNSGSEANDVAWRIAQFATGHRGGMVLAHAYHGITDAVAALTPGAGEPHDPRVVTLAPPPEGLDVHAELSTAQIATAQADANRAIRSLAERGHSPAAFFLDTAATSSGIYDPPPTWTAALDERVRSAGALIVADEVQYGLARSGSHFWGFERRGMRPDVVTLGKPVGNGYPMGVVIAGRPLIEAFQAKFGFFSTFGGNAVAAAAGLAVLEVIERERLLANADATGAYLRVQLEAVASRHRCLGAVRGAGLLVGLEVRGANVEDARLRTRFLVNTLAAESRVLIGSEGPLANILKLRPPLVFRPEHVDKLVQAIDAAAARVSD